MHSRVSLGNCDHNRFCQTHYRCTALCVRLRDGWGQGRAGRGVGGDAPQTRTEPSFVMCQFDKMHVNT